MGDVRPTDAGAPQMADRHGSGLRAVADPVVLEDGAMAGGIDRSGAAGALGHDGPGGAITRPVAIDLRTGRGLNSREHWRARSRRVKAEREAVAWALIAQKPAKPALPCVVLLTRVAPSNGLDDDNLAGSLKAIRDAVAEWLGVDDRDARVRWAYSQRRGPWNVEARFA